MKKVDKAASIRLSNEYIGTGSVRRMSAVPLNTPQPPKAVEPILESPLKPRAPLSARGRAGQALVEEVVLGVLDSVGLSKHSFGSTANEVA
jgi:serine/threonine-protein kinase 24/25/MST4